MAVTHLQCKECKSEYPLEALYVCERCFGPLEVAYDHSRLAGGDTDELRRRIQAGPQNIWRYADFLPTTSYGRGAPGGSPGPSAGARALGPAGRMHAADPRRPAGGSGWDCARSGSRTTRPTPPTRSRIASSPWPRPAPASSAFETIACASTGNLANSVAAHGAALGLESYVFIPADLEEQKVLATGVYGTKLVAVEGNYDDVNRLCTELCAERDWAFVNVNLRPYYAEGSKTLAFEIAEQLGFELPDRIVAPVASGSLFTKIGRGFAEWREVGLLDGELPRMNGAQAEGCAPVAQRVRRRSRRVQAGQAGHDRQVAGDRQPRRRARTHWSSRAAAAARWTPSATRRSDRASPCSRRRRACSPRPPAG